jgi:ATP-binding cassette, subfamily B, bacterial MsbA
VTALSHLFLLLGPRWRLLLAIAGLMALLAATTAAYAWAAGPLLGAFYGAGEASWPGGTALGRALPGFRGAGAGLGGLVLALAAVTAVRALARFGHDWLVLRLEQEVIHETRARLYAHLLRLPAPGAALGPAGELGSRISVEVDRLRLLVRLLVAGVGRNAATAMALLALAWSIDAAVAGLALLTLPLVGLAVQRLSTRARRAERRALDAQGRLAGLAAETARLLPLVRAYDAAAVASGSYGRQADEAHVAALRAGRLRSLLGPSLDLLGAAVVVAALLMMQERLAEGALSSEGAVTLVAALLLLHRPLQSLAGVAQGLSVGLAGLDRILEVLALPAEPPDKPGAATPAPPTRIELASVEAGYGNDDALEGLSLVLERGELVAVVGVTGAGKTTLLLVLLGLLRPRRGQVRVDGAPLEDLSQAAWRKLVAWVPQEPLIFHDTVTANIALGDAAPDPARVERAARQAGAHDRIRRLPLGYATVLREGGEDLSVGERQRICLARALYREAPVLLLDEPTAALDGASEGAFSDTLARLTGDRLIVLASHREATVRRANRVVVLDGGRIVDEGTPAELSARAGLYRSLFQVEPSSDRAQSPPGASIVRAAEGTP